MNAKAVIGTSSQSNERWLLLLPLAAGLFFGLVPFIFGASAGPLFGYTGSDSFLYRLAGAACAGYPVGLALGLRQGRWSALRLPVIATLTFNIGSLFACAVEILGGSPAPIVYVITLASLLFVAITLRLLTHEVSEPHPAPDISSRTRAALVFGGVLAGAFGLLPLIAPAFFAPLVGYKGTDVFVIRQAGAASLGYAAMVIWALRSGVWREIHLVNLMALVFNGLAFVASIIAFLSGDHLLIVVVIGAASLLYTVLAFISGQRGGKL
jgi:hypothetical protein